MATAQEVKAKFDKAVSAGQTTQAAADKAYNTWLKNNQGSSSTPKPSSGITDSQAARVAALESKRASGDTNNQTNQIDWSKEAGEQVASTPLIQPTGKTVASADDVNEKLDAFATDNVEPMDLKTESEIMYERDVKNMGFDAAQEFMNKRNQAFAEQATQSLQRLIESGQRNITDTDIYNAINKTITNYGGQVKNTPDWQNTISDIRSRMGIGSDIQSYVDDLAASDANAYVAGEYQEGVQPGTLKEKIDNYIATRGLDIDPSNINRHIDLEAKYEEYVNTPEYKNVIKKYNSQNGELTDLQLEKKNLIEDIKRDYPGLTTSQVNNIVADRTEELDRQIDTKTREIMQTYDDSEMIRALGEGRLKAYTDQEAINLENDWRTLEFTEGISKVDWQKDWDLRQQDYDKNTQKELTQLSLLEKYDLKDVTDNFIDGIDASDYVKDILRFRKEMDSNLDRKVSMTKLDDGTMVFYDEYSNIVNTVSNNGTPTTAPNFVGYEPVGDVNLDNGLGLLLSSNELTDGNKQCGEGVNDWLKEIGAADRNLFEDPISQKNIISNSDTAQVGSVVIFDPTGSSRGESQKEKYGFVAGHVGIITEVDTNGNVSRIGHWNKNRDGKYYEEALPAGWDKFISGYFDPTKSNIPEEEDLFDEFEFGFDPILDKQLQIYNITEKTSDWDRIFATGQELGYDKRELIEMSDNWKKHEAADSVGNMMDTLDKLKLLVGGSELTMEELSKLDLGFEPGSMASGLKRGTSFGLIPGTDKYDFWAAFNKVRDNLSLEHLANLKKKGATFGALSDKELEIIGNAVSALSKGQSKDGFLDEINKIQESFKREFDGVDPREYSAFYGERKIALQAALETDISSQAYQNYVNNSGSGYVNDELEKMIIGE